jgi:hypothetical protein
MKCHVPLAIYSMIVTGFLMKLVHRFHMSFSGKKDCRKTDVPLLVVNFSRQWTCDGREHYDMRCLVLGPDFENNIAFAKLESVCLSVHPIAGYRFSSLSTFHHELPHGCSIGDATQVGNILHMDDIYRIKGTYYELLGALK